MDCTCYYTKQPQFDFPRISLQFKKNPIGMTSGGSVVGGFIKVYWRDVVRTFFNPV